jgi:putative acetyltransferase
VAPVIRPYRPEDRSAAALIYYRAIMEGTVGLIGEPERRAWARSPEPDLEEPDKLLDQWCWIAEEDGQPTGFMSLCHDGLLDMAFVIPEVMGKGTAGALYSVLLARARAERLSRLTVLASPYSRSFLLKQGWVIDSEGMKVFDGHLYHLSEMSLSLGGRPPGASGRPIG